MSEKLADRETLIRLLMGSGDQALKAFCLQMLLRIERLESGRGAMLHSVTGKLEEAAEALDNETLQALPEVRRTAVLIDSVLEALS
ncbi:MAG TPA: hypothetical protein VI653_13370 [Steroidobacteraceae bacterium]